LLPLLSEKLHPTAYAHWRDDANRPSDLA
jgi:hypothetical protein